MPLNETIVLKLMNILLQNSYAQLFLTLERAPLDVYEIRIRSDILLDQKVYNYPLIDQVVAIWIEENNSNLAHERDIIVHAQSNDKHRVKHYYGCYNPLQSPLLFPKGDVGWHQNVLKRDLLGHSNDNAHTFEDLSTQNFSSVEDVLHREQQGSTLNLIFYLDRPNNLSNSN